MLSGLYGCTKLVNIEMMSRHLLKKKYLCNTNLSNREWPLEQHNAMNQPRGACTEQHVGFIHIKERGFFLAGLGEALVAHTAISILFFYIVVLL